jgi:hypothetical protein
MLNFFNTPKAYLEITNNKLFVSTLKKSGNKFFFQNPGIQKLQNFQILEETVFNPSSIYIFINSFLTKNDLINPRTIICLPNLNDYKGKDTEFKLFQIALISCKSDLKIHSLISKSLLN